MNGVTDAATTAWGIAIDGDDALRVRVARRGDTYALEALERVPADAAARWQPPAEEPLGVALPDLGVMYRRVELPPAEGETLRQMAAAQLELIAPVPADSLQWSCRRLPGGDVLIAAARRAAVDAAARDGAATVVTEAAAIGDAWARFYADREPALLVRIGRDTTSLLTVGRAGLQAAAVGGEGLDDVRGDGNAMAFRRWQRELAAIARQVSTDAERPTRCILLHDDPSDEVLDACAQATGLPAAAAPPPHGVAGARGDVLAALPALGAAVAALEPARANLVLATRAEEAPDARRRLPVSRRLIGAASAACVAILMLYGLDVWEASRVRAASPAAGGGSPEMVQALGIARYLLDRPPPPLFALAAISVGAPDSLQVKRFEYAGGAEGEIRFGGEVQGIGELDATLTALTRTPPLTKVEMRSGSVEREKWTFDVEAELVPLHRHVALQSQRDAAARKPDAAADDAKEATP